MLRHTEKVFSVDLGDWGLTPTQLSPWLLHRDLATLRAIKLTHRARVITSTSQSHRKGEICVGDTRPGLRQCPPSSCVTPPPRTTLGQLLLLTSGLTYCSYLRTSQSVNHMSTDDVLLWITGIENGTKCFFWAPCNHCPCILFSFRIRWTGQRTPSFPHPRSRYEYTFHCDLSVKLPLNSHWHFWQWKQKASNNRLRWSWQKSFPQ